MKIVQLQQDNGSWSYKSPEIKLKTPLVFIFGNRLLLEKNTIYKEIRELFPDGHLVFGSTCGDILNKTVKENTITITAVEFEKAEFTIETININNAEKNSYKTGYDLISRFSKKELKNIFVVSEGSFINGSQLTKGMNAATNNEILITGGLCGDDAKFEKTIASYNENPKQGEIVAIGFYGKTLETTFSIHGGWTPFGPERIVTKSKDNILYELDHKPALDLYKKYLGEKSKELPSAALLYPLNVKIEGEKQSIVRTILNINENENAMILAGDIPENARVQLMMTNIDNIAKASETAAKNANNKRKNKAELALLVSCIGRKLVLDQRVEEELKEVANVLGSQTRLAGFYSYGEIAPNDYEIDCQLHNQTMAITLISEE